MSEVLFAPDGYSPIRLLGKGGTARVYLAEKNGTNQLYALKTAQWDAARSQTEFLHLMRREHRLIGHLSYPGLIRIFEIHDEDLSHPFLAIEYCPGITIDRLKEIESPEIIENIVSAISINLYYLDRAGIHHGDLKPHNIFMNKRLEEYGRGELVYAKISDFSLALKAGEDICDRLGVGTIGYTAPETIDKKQLDSRSDIFSLGVIAYQLAAGQHPFVKDDSDPVRISSLVKEYDPPPPHEINPAISGKLSGLIISMLDKEPDRRPGDGFLICETLEEMGAVYPYKKAIRPKHLLCIRKSAPNENLLSYGDFEFERDIIERLLDYCGDDRNRLRIILEINFTAGLLRWQHGRLRFIGGADQIIHPRRFGYWDKQAFRRMPYSLKKRAILAAIVGTPEQAHSIGVINSACPKDYMTRPLLYYLGGHISQATIRRFAGRLAQTARKDYNNDRIAAELYLKTADLAKAYTVTLDAANQLINKSNYVAALELLSSLENLCRKKNDTGRLVMVLMQIADTEKTIGETVRAEKNYLKIIDLYSNRSPDRLLAETHKDLGDLYKIRQKYEEGINALREAEKIYSGLGDELELSHTLNNIGNILAAISKNDEAIRSYRRALKIQRRLKAAINVASTLSNMASIYFFHGRYQRTLRLFNMAIKIQREIGDAGEIARTLNNFGCLYNHIGDFDKALEYLEESISLNKRIGSKKELLFNFDNLASVLISGGRLKKAFRFLKEGLQLAREVVSIPFIAYFKAETAIVQKRMGFYGQALGSINEAIEVHKEIDDTRHYLICLIEKADIRLRMNDRTAARNTARIICEKAAENDDRMAHVSALILNGRIDDDIKAIERAIELAAELKAERTERIARMRLATVLLSKKETRRGLDILNELYPCFISGRSDIENAGFFILLGRYHLTDGELSKAGEYLEKGLHLAQDSALLPEIAEAASHLGGMNTQLKEHEIAYGYYKKGIEALKKIASDIKEDTLRDKFLSDGKIASLADEVKRLHRLLAKKRADPVYRSA
jgi:serine/threonine protein kinase/tetratricopeptide (TPR) repeat protein